MSLIKLNSKSLDQTWQKKLQEHREKGRAMLKALQDKTIKGHEWTGWFNYPARDGLAQAKTIQKFVDNCSVKYNAVILVGVGGSYLGTAAIHQALSPCFREQHEPELFILGHNLSSSYYQDFFKVMDRKNPIVIVISKSGATLEPNVAYQFVKEYLHKRYGNDSYSRFFIVTDPKSGQLREDAIAKKLKCFDIPQDIGGRFSVLTPVGLVPLAFLGIDIDKLMTGANKVFEDINKQTEIIDYAVSRFVAHENSLSVEALLYAEPKLDLFIEWLKQLFGESEGKNGKGLLPVGIRLTSDLHSLGQYLQDGKKTVFNTFLKTPSSSGSTLTVKKDAHIPQEIDLERLNLLAMQATMQAYAKVGRPCLELNLPDLDAFGLGAMIAFFETTCAISAGLLNLNAFDQPGVEAYKQQLHLLLRT